MPIEVEQKYRIADPSDVVARIIALGGAALDTVTQVDTYYAHPARDFAATDEALRIRVVGESNFVTYKGPKLDDSTKTRREIEVPLADGERAWAGYDQLLMELSFSRVAQVPKVRQRFHLQRDQQSIEVSVDAVVSVGDFLELEIIVADESEIAPAQRLIQTLAGELQLDAGERKSYLELLLGE
ncbi:MAG: class IV adenylate cyclase [Bythopirellula sp.]